MTKKKLASTRAVRVLKTQVKDLEEKLYLERTGGKLSLVPGVLSEKQILTIFQRTPAEHVYQRPGKGGETFDYVTGTYVKKVLNFVFGFNWDFEVVCEERDDLKAASPQARVLGRLTVRSKEGRAVVKMQYGRADLKFKKGTSIPVDLGNDMKAAATDALKKCAAELGVASDIYGKNEFREVKPEGLLKDAPATSSAKEGTGTAAAAVAEPIYCHGAGKEGCPHGAIIPAQVRDYSKKVYGRPLCRACQQEAAPTGRR